MRTILIFCITLAALFFALCDNSTDPTSSDCKVTILAKGNGTVSPNGEQTVAKDATLSVTATAANKNYFSHWFVSKGAHPTDSSEKGKFTIKTDAEIQAHFVKIVEELLPKDNGVSGWVVDPDKTCDWLGTAYNADDLFIIIDGAAPPYTDNGFKGGAFQGYADAQGEVICLQIYDQTSKDNAFEVFKHDDVASGSTYETISDLGDTARFETTEFTMDVVKDRYFIRLEPLVTVNDHYKQQMKAIVNHIISKM